MLSTVTERLRVLRLRDFRVFAVGYTTSTVGSAMTSVALAFAILGSEGSPTFLSLVLAARIVPMVVVLPIAGVLGDRFARRWVMIWADCGRALVGGALAAAFFAGSPPLWLLLTLATLGGLGEAVFQPSFDGVVPELVPPQRRQEANALLGLAESTANVAGPALAGLLVVGVSPAAVLLIDAISYLPSVGSLLLLRVAPAIRSTTSTACDDLRAGWHEFRSRPWLWVVTLQFTLFNLIVWAPYLVLGPVTAARVYGGASAWGTVVAIYGAGAIAGGLAGLAWRPGRPLVAATAVGFGWAAPSAALAVHAPLAVVCVAAFVAGCVSTVFGTLWTTTVQRRVPPEAISRVSSYVFFGAFSVGPIGLALAGPVAEATSVATVLAVGVAWQVLANGVLLLLPAIRTVRAESATTVRPAREQVPAQDTVDGGISEAARPAPR